MPLLVMIKVESHRLQDTYTKKEGSNDPSY